MNIKQRQRLISLKAKYHYIYVVFPAMKDFSNSFPFCLVDIVNAFIDIVKFGHNIKR